ncbi:MAG: GAF domain-containing protein [Bacteroidetes bacterium]|nr:MAG: GAF domain-containing protein [Bacteroidota bacterium]
MNYFFRTGFYLLQDGKLQVGPYQGALACINLARDTGVCWTAINQNKPVVVDDVEKFPGHITCDSRSKSEIVIPLKDDHDNIIGVMGVDSAVLNSFDEMDIKWLQKMSELV